MGSMVQLRHDTPLSWLQSDRLHRWKVTARFVLNLGDNKSIRCVRVRCDTGPSYYFSQERFDQLFEPVQEVQRGAD